MPKQTQAFTTTATTSSSMNHVTIPPQQQQQQQQLVNPEISEYLLNVNSVEEEFHPISCLNCKKLHKKCNKKLPQCDRCVSKGISCQYPDPKKTKKNTLSSGSTLNENTLAATLKNQNTHLSKRNVLDLYYSVICHCHANAVIERNQFENYILYRNLDDENQPDEIKAINCLYLSIQALAEQRCGLSELAEESATKARTCLSKIFDFHTNFYVTCAYVYLALFESGNGRFRNARYYLHNSHFYFEELKNVQLTPEQVSLTKTKIFVECQCNESRDEVSEMMRDLPTMFYLATGKMLPSQWSKLLVLDDVNTLNVANRLRAAEIVSGTSHKNLRELAPPEFRKDHNSNLCDTSYTMIICGLRIGILSKVGCGKQLIEESALKITYLTQAPNFALVAPNMVVYVAVAAMIHLHLVRLINSGQRANNQIGLLSDGRKGPVNYHEVLSMDLQALKLLATRFKKVSVTYGSLMQEIEKNIPKTIIDNLESKQKEKKDFNISKIQETSITFLNENNQIIHAPLREIEDGKLENFEVIQHAELTLEQEARKLIMMNQQQQQQSLFQQPNNGGTTLNPTVVPQSTILQQQQQLLQPPPLSQQSISSIQLQQQQQQLQQSLLHSSFTSNHPNYMHAPTVATPTLNTIAYNNNNSNNLLYTTLPYIDPTILNANGTAQTPNTVTSASSSSDTSFEGLNPQPEQHVSSDEDDNTFEDLLLDELMQNNEDFDPFLEYDDLDTIFDPSTYVAEE